MPDEPKDTQQLLQDILKAMNAGFTEMREGFAEIHTRLDKIEARLDKIEKRLDRFERKFDVLTSDIVDLRVRVSDIEPKPN
jgi:predicted nuclease with TOPRIM domain